MLQGASDTGHDLFVFWRRTDIVEEEVRPDAARPRLIDDLRGMLTNSRVLSPRSDYLPFCVVAATEICACHEDAIPVLCGRAPPPQTRRVYVWDIPTGRLHAEMNISSLWDDECTL